MTLFLLISAIDYEGANILSAHVSQAQAEFEADRLMADDMVTDSFEVRAIAPGAGRGVTTAMWRGQWRMATIEDDGPPCPAGTTSLIDVTDRSWHRYL